MKEIIRVENLSKSFGNLKAVNNISFSVKEGGIFAFLGLNGAGKSTTINMLCSILEKDSGKIFINNFDIDKNNNEIKNDIGIVFQNTILDDELTVYQNLKSRASLYSLSKQYVDNRINELTKIFHLNDILNRQFSKLSGGQKRRVDIARALIHKPSILFLDEPTTGLDPTTRVLVWEVLNNLVKNTNLTIFLTTHYMEEVLNANDIVIIDEGSIIARGSPNKLKDLFATDILKIYSLVNNEIESILKENNISYYYQNESYYINVNNSLEALNIINMNLQLFNNFEVLKGNMDQVFLNVTGKSLGDINE